MTAVLGLASGVSTVTESIWENRFKYVDELARMGANIRVESNVAIVTGVDHYTGARVQAPDLRAGTCLQNQQEDKSHYFEIKGKGIILKRR